MNMLHRFGIALASMIMVSSCSAQLLLASASAPDQKLTFSPNVTGNDILITGTASAGNTGTLTSTGGAALDLKALSKQEFQRPFTTPGLLSPLQAGGDLEPAKTNFKTSSHEETLADNPRAYDLISAPSNNGKLIRMISGIMRRFDEANIGAGQGTGQNTGFSGDTSFAVSRHLALVGGYEHNSFPSFDTMAFGVTFTFGRNAN